MPVRTFAKIASPSFLLAPVNMCRVIFPQHFQSFARLPDHSSNQAYKDHILTLDPEGTLLGCGDRYMAECVDPQTGIGVMRMGWVELGSEGYFPDISEHDYSLDYTGEGPESTVNAEDGGRGNAVSGFRNANPKTSDDIVMAITSYKAAARAFKALVGDLCDFCSGREGAVRIEEIREFLEAKFDKEGKVGGGMCSYSPPLRPRDSLFLS